jgi:bloom syndrome protein
MIAKSDRMVNMPLNLHRRGRLARIVIDEAHCVSQLGRDFRPVYWALGTLKRKFPGTPWFSLTATATAKVMRDIQHNLAVPLAKTSMRSFHSPTWYTRLSRNGEHPA